MKEFWIKNITNLRVSLKDLRIVVPAYATLNLMSKNYRYTEEELNKSLENGSLHAKSDKIKKRETLMTIVEEKVLIKEAADKINKRKKIEVNKKPLPEKEKAGYSLVEMKEENYLELELTDEQIIEQTINSIEE